MHISTPQTTPNYMVLLLEIRTMKIYLHVTHIALGIWQRSCCHAFTDMISTYECVISVNKDKLISKYGYPAEVHHVTTEDGYILTMHRIRRQGAQPFFLQHGLVDSSAGYVIMGPNISLGK